MKILSEQQIRSALYELANLTDVPVKDLKEEFERTIENISGRSATFLQYDNEEGMRLQSLALEKMFRDYKKALQFRKFLKSEAPAGSKRSERKRKDRRRRSRNR